MKTNKILIPLLLGIIPILSFVISDEDNTRKRYFEGQVIYDITYKPYDKNTDPEFLKKEIGATMVFTFRKGNYKKEYFAPDGKLLSTRYLDLKQYKSFATFTDTDTILWYDIRKEDSNTFFKVFKDTLISNYSCQPIKIFTTVTSPAFKGATTLESLSWFAKDLAVNPDWYYYFREADFDQIIRVTKSIAIESKHQGVYWEHHLKMKSVVKRRVAKEEIRFVIHEGRPLLEL